MFCIQNKVGWLPFYKTFHYNDIVDPEKPELLSGNSSNIKLQNYFNVLSYFSGIPILEKPNNNEFMFTQTEWDSLLLRYPPYSSPSSSPPYNGNGNEEEYIHCNYCETGIFE